MTTVLGFATTTPTIAVIVDTFERRRRKTSPKVTTVLGFATTTPPIAVTVSTFVIRNVKSDDSSAFPASPTQVRRKSDTSPTQVRRSANACERLRTLANACERLRTIANDCGRLRTQTSPPGPLDPNLKTGTLVLRIREKIICK